MNITTLHIFNHYTVKLTEIYELNEAQSIVFLLFEHFHQMDRLNVLSDREIQNFDGTPWESALKRLFTHEPVQYIIGKAWFYEHEFKVNSSVLIPRNETEELVHLIIKRHCLDEKIKILDLGTGSGCIPISLKKSIPQAIVYSVDISEEALKVAKENAALIDTDINFIQADMRSLNIDLPIFDGIVSNPPYVTQSEKMIMKSNVLDYEPSLALFVEDNHPLEFYIAIESLASRYLKSGGKIYLEINENLGIITRNLFKNDKYTSVELRKDIHGKDRIVTAKKL